MYLEHEINQPLELELKYVTFECSFYFGGKICFTLKHKLLKVKKKKNLKCLPLFVYYENLSVICFFNQR